MFQEASSTSVTPRIVYCHCAFTQLTPADVKQQVLEGLCASGVKFEAVADLCEVCARGEALASDAAGGPVRIAACYPRAVKSLLEARQRAGGPTAPLDVKVCNMRTGDAKTILEQLIAVAPREQGAAAEVPATIQEKLAPPATGKWLPWFPVIEYSRCTACQQCKNFCLFGVYEARDGQVLAAHPEKCKAHCPACARVCPQAAIIFPKHPLGPINGDEIRPEDTSAQKMQTDFSSVLGADVYEALRKRNPSGAFPSQQQLVQALDDRRKCACQKIKKLSTDTPDPQDIKTR